MLQNLADDDAKKSGRSRNPQANPYDFSHPQEPTVGEEIIKSIRYIVGFAGMLRVLDDGQLVFQTDHIRKAGNSTS